MIYLYWRLKDKANSSTVKSNNKGGENMKQRTLIVDGEKIVIKTKPKLWKGNLQGFNININGNKYFKATLTMEEAETKAYVEWVKKHH